MKRGNVSFNFFLKDKKGLSAVVTTLLIILLAIVLIGVIWVVIRGVVDEGTENINLGQFTLNLEIREAYVDSTDSQIVVNVRRSSGSGNVTGVRFLFFDGTATTNPNRDVPLQEAEERAFSFTPSEIPTIGEGDSVSVAPIFISSGRERVGSVTDTFQIGTSSGTGEGDAGEDMGDEGGTTPECSDGVDNNQDGTTDYPDDPGCDSATDTTESYCGDGTCRAGENSTSCSADCSSLTPQTCDGTWDGAAEDPEVECDGTNVQGCNLNACVCESGYTADGAGGCSLNPSVNSGSVLSVWPDQTAVIFFDSGDLPKNPSVFPNYGGRYINFSGGACTTIGYLQYVSETDRTYAQLNQNDTGQYSVVSSGESYSIWDADVCSI